LVLFAVPPKFGGIAEKSRLFEGTFVIGFFGIYYLHS